MNVVYYKRNQVDGALWRVFAPNRVAPVSRKFLTRVKRLLELDRGSGGSGVGYAFFDTAPTGLGSETQYSSFNVFCMALGLDLLDSGYKQSEIVYLLQQIRPDLERQYQLVQRRPPVPSSHVLAEDRSAGPTYEHKGTTMADCSRFMLIRKVEMSELLPPSAGQEPVFMMSEFFPGRARLSRRLAKFGIDERLALIVEIAELAVVVARTLEETPARRRGRPSKKG